MTFDAVRVDPPHIRPMEAGSHAPAGAITLRAIGAERDRANRALGEAGERWVVFLERGRLESAGRPDLADAVEWTSKIHGDGSGYDVLSFETGGAERWVEVKTTNLTRTAPFFLSANEVAVWRASPDRYALYRVFDFVREPRLYVLRGPVDEVLSLEPVQ